MISTIDIAKLFFNQDQSFKAFLSNHEKFSIFSCFNFLAQAKASQTTLEDFYKRMNHVDVPVTNAMIGVVEWPYIHNKWDTAQRLNTIATHYELLHGEVFHDRFSQLMNIHQDEEVTIMQFDEAYDHVSVVLDRPKWFIREGEMVINLVQHDLRVASIAFTLGYESGETTAYIGAVQGIHAGISSEQSLAIYKRLTKLFFGLRPRTLLLEALKVYLNDMGIEQLYGISDQHRHHRHRYFGFDHQTDFKNDYNAFWEEHGGYLDVQSGFYKMHLKPAIREIKTIPSKKRSQYRKRNAFIEELDTCLSFNHTNKLKNTHEH